MLPKNCFLDTGRCLGRTKLGRVAIAGYTINVVHILSVARGPGHDPIFFPYESIWIRGATDKIGGTHLPRYGNGSLLRVRYSISNVGVSMRLLTLAGWPTQIYRLHFLGG